MRNLNPRPAAKARILDVPLRASLPLVESLAIKLGSKEAARRATEQVAVELGLPADAPPNLSAALALTKLGGDVDLISKSLAWDEFEEYCAAVISAAGYSVQKNVRLRKPTRQIDIVAESPGLVLTVDCKHWRREAGASSLGAQAISQIERTKIYARRSAPGGERVYLPVILTMLDNRVRVVEGVPVVPLKALREFLASVSRFDDSLAFVKWPTG